MSAWVRSWGRLAGCLLPATLVALLVPGIAAGAIPPAPTPVNSSPPTVTGNPAPGQTLTCSVGAWANNPSAYAYAWLRDGAPIAGQTANTYVVQSTDRGHSISCAVTASNSGGEYAIVGLPSGSYKVQFTPAEETQNYLPRYYSNQSTLAGATALAVTAPNATGNIDAALQPGGQISGRVTAAGGIPVAEVDVCAFSTKSSFERCAVTNTNGEYTIVGMPTGFYTLQFFSFAEFFGEGGGNYLFPSVNSVQVTAPNTTANVDVALSAGGQITGKVTSAATHEPIASAFVCAFNAEELGGCQFTSEHGEYTISGLATGAYHVRFQALGGNYLVQYYNKKQAENEAENVTVTAGSSPTSNIDAELQAGGQIAGAVKDASTHAVIANANVCAFNGSEDAGCGNTNGNGEYTISGLPSGTYRVEFTASRSNHLSQSQSGISVIAPNTTSGVNAELQAGGQIAGTVKDASTHAALRGAIVCASGAGCVSTNGAGEYTIGGLATSTYEVSFSSGGNYLNQVVQGISVTAPNTTSGVNAELQPGAQIEGRVTAAASGFGVAGIEACAVEVSGGNFVGCSATNAAGGSARAASNALVVPAPTSAFKQAKKPVFDAKSDDLDFFLRVGNPGTFSFNLSFANSDVGFADSLGISLAQGDAAQLAKASGKGKGCKSGKVKHKGRCVAAKVPFAKGSQSVSAGAVEVKVHADAKAIKALKAGHTLHVSGSFKFQSAYGGVPVTHTVSTVVQPPKKKKGKGHGRK